MSLLSRDKGIVPGDDEVLPYNHPLKGIKVSLPITHTSPSNLARVHIHACHPKEDVVAEQDQVSWGAKARTLVYCTYPWLHGCMVAAAVTAGRGGKTRGGKYQERKSLDRIFD